MIAYCEFMKSFIADIYNHELDGGGEGSLMILANVIFDDNVEMSHLHNRYISTVITSGSCIIDDETGEEIAIKQMEESQLETNEDTIVIPRVDFPFFFLLMDGNLKKIFMASVNEVLYAEAIRDIEPVYYHANLSKAVN
jgi:hypothetical protein